MSSINKRYLQELKRSCEVPPGVRRDQIIKIMELFTMTFPEIKFPVVGFGGVLCLEGIRSVTSDVDVSVNAEAIKTLESSGIFEFVTEVVSGSNDEIIIFRCGVLDVHPGELIFAEDTEPYQHYNFNVMTLESILKYKREWNRDKDQDDIRNIEKVLASRSKQQGMLERQYSKLVSSCKVSPLEKNDIFKLTDKLHDYFPFLNECEIDMDSALCLYGVISSVPSITFTCPMRHQTYLKGMGIFHDSYVVENNKPVDTLRCGALTIYFGEPINPRGRYNSTFGFIAPNMHEILKYKENSNDPNDIKHVRMLRVILR